MTELIDYLDVEQVKRVIDDPEIYLCTLLQWLADETDDQPELILYTAQQIGKLEKTEQTMLRFAMDLISLSDSDFGKQILKRAYLLYQNTRPGIEKRSLAVLSATLHSQSVPIPEEES